MPRGAALKMSSSGALPRRSLSTAFWPPMALQEPCSTLTMVTPPARLR
jgi:hypothetical protein